MASFDCIWGNNEKWCVDLVLSLLPSVSFPKWTCTGTITLWFQSVWLILSCRCEQATCDRPLDRQNPLWCQNFQPPIHSHCKQRRESAHQFLRFQKKAGFGVQDVPESSVVPGCGRSVPVPQAAVLNDLDPDNPQEIVCFCCWRLNRYFHFSQVVQCPYSGNRE